MQYISNVRGMCIWTLFIHAKISKHILIVFKNVDKIKYNAKIKWWRRTQALSSNFDIIELNFVHQCSTLSPMTFMYIMDSVDQKMFNGLNELLWTNLKSCDQTKCVLTSEWSVWSSYHAMSKLSVIVLDYNKK